MFFFLTAKHMLSSLTSKKKEVKSIVETVVFFFVTPQKIFAFHILVYLTLTILPETMCSFFPGQSTLDMIFIARILLKKNT